MDMKVIWSLQAKDSLQQTSNYIRKEFGKKSKQKFLDEVLHVASLLDNNPYLGQVEPLLDEAPVEYRSIVVNHINKLVYYITTTDWKSSFYGTHAGSLSRLPKK